jgi:hypothetical protein
VAAGLARSIPHAAPGSHPPRAADQQERAAIMTNQPARWIEQAQVILAREGTWKIEYAPPTETQPISGWNLYQQYSVGWRFVKRYGDRDLAVRHAESGSPWMVTL